jgi:hypothetical protein
MQVDFLLRKRNVVKLMTKLYFVLLCLQIVFPAITNESKEQQQEFNGS